jgi:lipoprotein NlpD
LLQACSGAGVAPVTNRNEVKEYPATTTQRDNSSQVKAAKKPVIQNKTGYHIVSQGDTLYSIAWRYNFDYKEVARWNKINSPYIIYPGQLIRLKPVIKKQGETLKTPVKSPVTTTATKEGAPKQTLPEKKATIVQKEPAIAVNKSEPKPALPKGPVKWSWPSNGKIVKSDSPTSKKGLDILGSAGQQVKAAATGEVVYSGGGLVGYGKLIIIKHNETYLSAYAYNSKLLVKEGDRVKAGEAISVMGQDHTGRTMLHFEIRQNGKPINPTQYLPKKRT